MSAGFKVGEIAIMCNAVYFPAYNGVECEVIGGLEPRVSSQNPHTPTLMYLVCAADGKRFVQAPHKLRKKQPPRSAKAIMREAILKAKQPVGEPA